MKRFIQVFLITVLLICGMSFESYAFQNEPNGFRNLYWGESIAKVRATRTLKFSSGNKDHGWEIYTTQLSKDEEPTLSGVPISLKTIVLSFYNERLSEVVILFPDIDVFEKLQEAMIFLYNTPSFIKENQLTWVGEITEINLIRREEQHYCMVRLSSVPALRERIQETVKQGW